jgi:hypothetical protein
LCIIVVVEDLGDVYSYVHMLHKYDHL